ncbi:PDDEXK nuclease domain-containing protein [Streptomyces pulveraceus]|uniref:PDDEXK nuclease domain-containing protein n=1 Tax=Streptomyces pulveraceus TaxID=68258 RepID=A0ABW1GTD1_9ACTN
MDNEPSSKAVVPGQRGSELPPGFHEMIDDLKSVVRGAHVRAQLKVNTEMLQMYWEIGRTILARQREEKWGAKGVGRIATELRTEFPGQRGFSRSSLHYMVKMARIWPEPIVQQAAGQLPWAHLQVLMDKCKTQPVLDFYIQHAVRNGWSRDDLTSAVHHALHLSHAAAINNFDAVIPERSEAAKEIIKDPYRLDFTELGGRHTERDKECDGPTVGILIAESRDRSMVEYALRGYNQPLAVSTYAGLPDRVRELLPSAEDLSRIADGVLNTPHTTDREPTPGTPQAENPSPAAPPGAHPAPVRS